MTMAADVFDHQVSIFANLMVRMMGADAPRAAAEVARVLGEMKNAIEDPEVRKNKPIDRSPHPFWKNRVGAHEVVEVPAGTDVRAVVLDDEPTLPGMPLPDDNPKTALGSKKPGTDAIPPVAILELGRAMANGASKYGRFNWRDKAVTTSVYTNAIDRHTLAFRDGEDIAADSGVHHLAHIMACCAILLDAIHTGKLNDDRRRDGVVGNVIDTLTRS